MKTLSFPMVMFAAVVLPTPGMATEDSAAVPSQNRETVRQMEQETNRVQQQTRWEQTVRTHDRNGDGRLDAGEKLAALEKIRLRNQELVRQMQGMPADPEPAGPGGQASVQRGTGGQEQAQSREQDRLQTRDQQRTSAQQREWWRQYDANRDGSLSDQEFAKALATLDRERDATRDRLKAKAASKDQSKELLKQQDQLRDQDRDVLRTTDLDRDRLMDRDRMGTPSQPRRGGGGRGR